jgi:hypothetical protein
MNKTTPIVQTHRAIQRALKREKAVGYRFLDTEATPVTNAFYYTADRCIIFTCGGECFRAYPSTIDRFEISK